MSRYLEAPGPLGSADGAKTLALGPNGICPGSQDRFSLIWQRIRREVEVAVPVEAV